MRYDAVNFQNIKFFLFYIKKYEMRVHSLGKCLTLRLMKLDKNYRSYCLKSLTA